MLISQGCQYAMRAVLHMAQNEHAPLLSKDIASRLDMPPHFLAKILRDLSKHGLLVSYKGRGGGFRLARPPAEITLAQIVLAVEGEGFVHGCILGLPRCSDESPCLLHHQWSEIRTEILDMLGNRSVQQFIDEAATHQAGRLQTDVSAELAHPAQ